MPLFYREKGNPDRPPLIILHGLWGASENWLPVAGILSEKFHVILPDLRNHGNSPHSSEHRYENLTQDILTFIQRLRLPRRPYIAGHSMGGKTLMLLLLQEPEIADKAAIIDIAPKNYPPDHHQLHRTLMEFARKFSFAGCNSAAEVHQAIRKEIRQEELCQILFKNIRKKEGHFEWKININAIQNHLAGLMAWNPPVRLSPYPHPLLFIRGELSHYLSAADEPDIRLLFPLAQFASLAAAHHCIHSEQPQALAQTLTTFFLT